MSGLINLIKSVFGGIFSFLGGLLNRKKATIAPAGSGTAELSTAPKTRKSAGYFLELDDSEIHAPAKQEAPVAVATAATKSEPVEASPKKSSKRSELLAAAAASNGSAPASAPEAPSLPAPEPVAVAAVTKESEPAGFATKYLVPTANSGRRRPGANMNSYLDMARNLKASSN